MFKHFLLIIIGCILMYQISAFPILVEIIGRILNDIEVMLNGLGISLSGIQIKTKAIHEISAEYDFIVVGAGAAGSVIANRLSEIGEWKILLLEIGNPENLITQIPLFAPLMQWTDYNWAFTSEPQDNFCLGMRERRCSWPRGRALGGSSVINYMIYTRGNRRDYDRWGIEGWSYKDVLPYFIKSEQVHLDTYDHGYHGTDGPLNVGMSYASRLSDAFLGAGKELGYDIVDYNGRDQIGFSNIQATLRKGRRNSAAKAFLEPIRHRSNLDIRTRAMVTKVNINELKQASGVQFIFGDKEYAVRARKEVILSAGCFNSAKLLMLSGIGPADHLHDFGIPIHANLPVGSNLQDHISYVGLTFLMNETVQQVADLINPKRLNEWYNTGKGPLASLGGVESLAFIRTAASNDPDPNYPDIELILAAGGSMHSDYGLFNRQLVRISDYYYDKVFRPDENIPGWSIYPMLLHPKSKGLLRLRSTDPRVDPILYGNYFTDAYDEDRRTLIEGIKFVLRLVKTESFQRFNSTLSQIRIPDCAHHAFASDSYWGCALEYFSSTLHHQIGTCRMGDDGVVNAQLKVHGIANLRVADTSIIPTSISAHTNAPSIMIGEKASDLIKGEWLLNESSLNSVNSYSLY